MMQRWHLPPPLGLNLGWLLCCWLVPLLSFGLRGLRGFELCILPQEFVDDRHRSTSYFPAINLDRNLKVRDQGVGGYGVECKREDLHGC